MPPVSSGKGRQQINDQSGRYLANFITKHINDKVASLYAKNPEAEAKKRDRLIYKIWDGKVESEWAATMALQGAMMGGMPTPQAVQAIALLQDIAQGRRLETLLDKICETLKILYQVPM